MGSNSNLVGREGKQYAGRVSSTGKTPPKGVKKSRPKREPISPSSGSPTSTLVKTDVKGKKGKTVTTSIKDGGTYTFKSSKVKGRTIKGGTHTVRVKYINGNEYVFIGKSKMPISPRHLTLSSRIHKE